MGTGIGIDCRRCGDQLTYDNGFNQEKRLCNRCNNISDKAKELIELLDEYDKL